MPAKPIPEGYHTLNPHLAVDDAAQAIEFYKRAFGAKERERVPTPDGKIAHAGECQLQRTGDRCRGECEHMHFRPQLLELLLMRNAESLFFIDDHKA